MTGDKPALNVKPDRAGQVSTCMGDHLQTEAVVLIFILSQIFFSHYHSFSLVLHVLDIGKACILKMLYNLIYALAVNVDQVSPGPVEVGDFLFWLVIFFGLALSLKLQIELSEIH